MPPQRRLDISVLGEEASLFVIPPNACARSQSFILPLPLYVSWLCVSSLASTNFDRHMPTSSPPSASLRQPLSSPLNNNFETSSNITNAGQISSKVSQLLQSTKCCSGCSTEGGFKCKSDVQPRLVSQKLLKSPDSSQSDLSD